jgi:hypothetical protein
MQLSFFKKNIFPFLFIALAMLGVFFLISSNVNAVRVGDGAEYYGLYYAWATGHRPWMTPAAYNAYDVLFSSHNIAGLVTTDALVNAFQVLRVGTTSDFNHFWFYSFLAFICGKIISLVGIHLTISQCFLALHCVLLGVTASIAYRAYAWKGVLAVALMMFASPMFWFIDKAHTEFFTVCLILSAVIFLTSKQYLSAALCIALASTQNPSFALVACIPLFYRVVLQWNKPYSVFDLAIFTATVLAVLIHPGYYFARYGVLSPQFLGGGAVLGENLSTFYVWILDPDIGLLPNWPLGMAVLLLAAGMCFWHKSWRSIFSDKYWFVFLAFYLLINLYAASSTTNLNSGATPGLARYALWFLPLAFPLFLKIFQLFPWRSKQFYCIVPLVLAVSIISIQTNDPGKPEQYTVPSISSFFIQSNFSRIYNPPAEIFLERYSGFGDTVHQKNLRAIVGPDCKKMLLLSGPNLRGGVAPYYCFYDEFKLSAYVNALQLPHSKVASKTVDARYEFLPAAAIDQIVLKINPGSHNIGLAGDGNTILAEGWSQREDWGVWSEGKRAKLVLPCNAKQFFGSDKTFTIRLKLRPFNKQSIKISGESGLLWEGDIVKADQEIQFDVAAKNCIKGQYELNIQIPDAISPQQLGGSSDARALGIGLSAFDIPSVPQTRPQSAI